MNYTFSSDTCDVVLKDLDETSKMSEDFFGMQKDTSQFQPTEENKKYIFENLLDFLNIIKLDGKIIGVSFMLPSTNKIMNDFINNKITENQLFEEVKKQKLNKNNFESLYLCSTIVNKESRGKGLSIIAFQKIFEKLINKNNSKISLFYWKYSKEGEYVAEKLSKLAGLKLFSKID